VERGGYDVDGQWVDLAAAQAATLEATSFHAAGCRTLDQRPSRSILFEPASSLAAAEPRSRAGRRVCVLSFASPRRPGGGFLTGASAQEEDLCRASGLYPTLVPQRRFYEHPPAGLHTDRMIYSPGVPVFRDEAWELLPEPFLVDVVTVAAVNLRAARATDRGRVEAVMRSRMQKMLGLCQAKGVHTLVLGAWGTGVFGLEPWHVATWFKEALQHARFEEVIFPLMDPIKRQIFEAVFTHRGALVLGPSSAQSERGNRRERKAGGVNKHRQRGGGTSEFF